MRYYTMDKKTYKIEEIDRNSKEAINFLLRSTGYTRVELAEILGISTKTINQWVRRRSIPEKQRELIDDLKYGNGVIIL